MTDEVRKQIEILRMHDPEFLPESHEAADTMEKLLAVAIAAEECASEHNDNVERSWAKLTEALEALK